MNTRTNISSIVRNVFAVVGAAAVIASPAMAAGSKATPSVGTGVVQVSSGQEKGKISTGGLTEVGSGEKGGGGWIDPRVQIADYDHNGIVDASDLYNFFVAWNDGKPSADINGDGWVDAADVWFYLAIWNSVTTGEGNTGTLGEVVPTPADK